MSDNVDGTSDYVEKSSNQGAYSNSGIFPTLENIRIEIKHLPNFQELVRTP